MNVLAIDQGTSGTKAVVVDAAGAVLALAEEPVAPVYLPDGGVEVDPEALWASVLAAGRRAVADAGVPLAAVALANQGETVLAWDRADGRPLGPALVWQDRRAQDVCDARSEHADEVARRTGLVLDPYFSAPKLRRLRDHVTRDGVVTTTDAWLVHRLCGAFVSDSSTASRSLLLGLDDVTWDPWLVDLFGLTGEALPDVVPSDAVVGTTDAFGPAVPLTGLVVDQQAALLAQGCVAPGSAKCTYGTGAFLLAQTGTEAVRSSAGLTTSVAWTLRGRTSYCVDGQVYTVASAVRWLEELGLLAGGGPALDTTAADDSAGVLAVPALAGLAAPFWAPGATASLSGMTLSTERGHVVRAVLEGVAAQVAVLAGLVARDLGRPLDRLRVDGGLTRSAALMQVQADLAQVPVDVYPSAHATPLGAVACARLALDPTLAVEDAVPAWTPERTYEPRWGADRAAEFLDRWQAAAWSAAGRSAS